jgi:hypothetical protein
MINASSDRKPECTDIDRVWPPQAEPFKHRSSTITSFLTALLLHRLHGHGSLRHANTDDEIDQRLSNPESARRMARAGLNQRQLGLEVEWKIDGTKDDKTF